MMGNQRKLTADEIARIAMARSSLAALPPWVDMPGGELFWADAMVKLSDAQVFGTTDGKPWIETKAEAKAENELDWIADVVCVIDPDNCEAVYVDGNLVIASETVYLGELARKVEGKIIRLRQFECDNDRQWPKLLSDLNCEKIQHIAGEPPIDAEFEVIAEPEPVIDDKWAAVWPRRWVMVRDHKNQPWEGPYRLGMANKLGVRYVVFSNNDERRFAKRCRPATAAEIATVEPKEAEPEKPEIGKGYQEATQDDSQRTDREMWNGECWLPARLGIVMDGETYRVPEVGDGYRPATAADRERGDRDMRDVHGHWVPAHIGIHASNYTYRVPVDRVPTVEDAKDQPIVMVWQYCNTDPIRAKLLARLDDRSAPFICCDGIRIIDGIKARHLRSYE